MNADRFGSYSSRSTVAATSQVRRLKSICRYFCLCPPAMPREVTWPLLLRPPVLRLPSVRAFTGLPFHSADLSTRIRPRCDEVTGLYVLSAIARASDAGGDVDGLALGQGHDRLLHVGALVGLALPALGLALLGERVDARHGDPEQGLDRRLDLGLARALGDLEDDRVLLGDQGRLLGDVGGEDDIVMGDVDLGLLLRCLSH